METIKELKEICQFHKRKNRSLSDFGYLFHRELSIYITKAVLKLTGNRIRPNHISIFNVLFGIIILILIALTKNQLFLIFLLLLFYFSFLLDKVDGEIARYEKVVTLRGAYLDEIYHFFVQNGLILAVAINRDFLYLGIAGFFLFFFSRYLHKIRYFVYAQKYKSNRDKFLTKRDLSKSEKSFIGFLNIFLLRAGSFARRQDIFLLLVFIGCAFFFNSGAAWLLLFSLWLTMLVIYCLRFLFLHYFLIDRDIQLIDEEKL